MTESPRLEQQIDALLADSAGHDNPLHAPLSALLARYRQQQIQLQRLTWISDRYQSAVRDENRSLIERDERQQRRLRKIARISDGYQDMQREQAEHLKTASMQDPLTRLPNRRCMLDHLAAEHLVAERREQPFTVALVDVDHFKRINDEYGHDIGDQVLVQLAALLQSQLREGDRCARWGGEEFLLLWPQTPGDLAKSHAEGLRLTIESTVLGGFEGGLRTTVSIGLASHRSGDSYTETIRRADLALYRAKHAGRNRVVAHDA